MVIMKFHGDMSKEKFFIEWFGFHGREVGTKKEGFHRRFIDNPMDFLDFIEMCKNEHEIDECCRPCWTTVLIYGGYNKPVAIDRIYFDFDDDSRYCPKCRKYFKKKSRSIRKMTKLGLKHAHVRCKTETIIKPRKKLVEAEVLRFLSHIRKGDPFIVETYKGYHIYLFTDRIYKIDRTLIKKVYDDIKRRFTQDLNFKFLDPTSKQDVKRFARVPLTPHEKTGEPCRIMRVEKTYDGRRLLSCELVESEVKSLDNYLPNIDRNMVRMAITSALEEDVRDIPEEEIERRKSGQWNSNGYEGFIRPCFQERLNIGYMPHDMRLAFEIEAYFSGYNTFNKLLSLFMKMRDYSEDISSYQVRYFLDHEPAEYPPYRCRTLHRKGYCLGKKCNLFERNVAPYV